MPELQATVLAGVIEAEGKMPTSGKQLEPKVDEVELLDVGYTTETVLNPMEPLVINKDQGHEEDT